MDETQVARLIAQTGGEVRVAAALMAFAGFRLVEVPALRHRDIAYTEDGVVIRVRSKDGATVRIAAGEPLRSILAAEHGEAADKVVGWSAARLRDEMNRAMKAAGVEESAHALRYWFATSRMANAR